MKLGVRLESLRLPLRRAIAEASRMGAGGVQVDAAGDLAPERLSQTGRREFRNLLRSHDLELTALGCPLRHGLDVAADLQPRIEHVRRVMSLSYDLGPRVAIVEMPPVPAERPPDPAPEVSAGGLILAAAPRAEDPATLLRESLVDLGAHGDRTGTTLALEGGRDSAEKMAAYLATFVCGGLGVNFDPADLLMNGHDPIRSLTLLHARLVHVQARDARRSGRGVVEVSLGAGDIDWMTFVAVLDSVGYRGWRVGERDGKSNDPTADVAGGLAVLRRFVRKQ